MPHTPPRYRFGHDRRLHGRRDFAAVYGCRCRKVLGPITVYGRPNGLGYRRLGLSVPKKVGGAVRRNRVKRLLREAFRLAQHELPGGYDWVVAVRPHETLSMAEYQRLLLSCAASVDREWRRRSRRSAAGGGRGRAGPERA